MGKLWMRNRWQTVGFVMINPFFSRNYKLRTQKQKNCSRNSFFKSIHYEVVLYAV